MEGVSGTELRSELRAESRPNRAVEAAWTVVWNFTPKWGLSAVEEWT